MRTPSKTWKLAFAVAFVSLSNAASAEECDENATSRFPAANSAISTWEGATSTRLPEATRVSVLKEFCVAAVRMMSDPAKPIAPSAIDAAIPKTFQDYLGRVSQPNSNVRSVDATLRQYLGFGGLSRGKPNRFTQLTIKYLQKIDSLTVNGERLSPSPCSWSLSEMSPSTGSSAARKFATRKRSRPPV